MKYMNGKSHLFLIFSGKLGGIFEITELFLGFIIGIYSTKSFYYSTVNGLKESNKKDIYKVHPEETKSKDNN
jgi:hypothetical protein